MNRNERSPPGVLANPKYEHGGVACLREACAFYDIDEPDPGFRECCVMLSGSRAALIAEILDGIGKMLHKRL